MNEEEEEGEGRRGEGEEEEEERRRRRIRKEREKSGERSKRGSKRHCSRLRPLRLSLTPFLPLRMSGSFTPSGNVTQPDSPH